MQVSVRSFRGAERADFDLDKITLLIGDGGASKTSILRAVAMAATGEKVLPGVNVKDAKARLVRRGADKGSVTLTGDDWSTTIKWPKCEVESTGLPAFVSAYAAGLESILDVKPKERAPILAPLLKTAPDALDLVSALRDADVHWPTKGVATTEEGKAMEPLRLDPINQRDTAVFRIFGKIWPLIQKDGWDAASRQADKTGTEMKGQWKQATGGETYGKSKADDWQPAGWSADLESATLEALQRAADVAKKALEDAIAARAASEVNADDLRVKASNLSNLEAALRVATEKKNAAYAEHQKLAAKSPPIVPSPGIPCPHCGGELQVVQGQDLLNGPALKKAEPVDSSAVKQATDARKAYFDAIDRVKAEMGEASADVQSLTAELNEARKAQEKIDGMAGQDSAAGDVESCRQAVAAADARLAAFKAKAEADKLHKSIQVNAVIMEILGDNGVRRQKLVKVLESFNDGIMAPLCATAKWKPVMVTPDLEVEYGGIPFPDLCKSEQHRVLFVMQIAHAKLDGSKLLVIDDADALPVQARGGLIAMLKDVGIPALVAMMVPSPDKAPDLSKKGDGVTVWVEGGCTESYADAKARYDAKVRKAA